MPNNTNLHMCHSITCSRLECNDAAMAERHPHPSLVWDNHPCHEHRICHKYRRTASVVALFDLRHLTHCQITQGVTILFSYLVKDQQIDTTYTRDAQSVALEPIRLFGSFYLALCIVCIFNTREIFYVLCLIITKLLRQGGYD